MSSTSDDSASTGALNETGPCTAVGNNVLDGVCFFGNAVLFENGGSIHVELVEADAEELEEKGMAEKKVR